MLHSTFVVEYFLNNSDYSKTYIRVEHWLHVHVSISYRPMMRNQEQHNTQLDSIVPGSIKTDDICNCLEQHLCQSCLNHIGVDSKHPYQEQSNRRLDWLIRYNSYSSHAYSWEVLMQLLNQKNSRYAQEALRK